MLSRPDGQKLLCRGKCLYLQPRGAEQTTQAFPNRRFVVNYTNNRVVLIHGFTSQESETRRERNSIGPWSGRDWTLVQPRYDVPLKIPNFSAARTRSARDLAPIFCMM